MHTACLSPRRDDIWALCLAFYAVDGSVVLHGFVLEHSIALIFVRVRVSLIIAIMLGSV
jgi:hypothetical protein